MKSFALGLNTTVSRDVHETAHVTSSIAAGFVNGRLKNNLTAPLNDTYVHV